VRCPNDGATLLMSERRGVEIDYCPDCRGVWLDRGELDKLVDRADHDRDDSDDRDDRDDRADRAEWNDDERDRDRRDRKPAKKKKSSFFKDLFEFGEE
jgi:uncharacterized protein